MAPATAPDALFTIPHGENTLSIRPYRGHADNETQVEHLNNMAVWKTLRNVIPFPYKDSDAVKWADYVASPENMIPSGKWTPSERDPVTKTLTGKGTSEGPLVPACYVICVDDVAVGGIGLTPYKDVEFRNAELGYWLSETFWGKGIMSVVVPQFVRWAFANLGWLARLDSGHFSQNPKSGKVLLKAGFRKEGERPDSVTKEGVLYGQWTYGCLRKYVQEEEEQK